ncbi:hypothetical protein VTK26DRAFT_6169 [Humicola hyalothermophila]
MSASTACAGAVSAVSLRYRYCAAFSAGSRGSPLSMLVAPQKRGPNGSQLLFVAMTCQSKTPGTGWGSRSGQGSIDPRGLAEDFPFSSTTKATKMSISRVDFPPRQIHGTGAPDLGCSDRVREVGPVRPTSTSESYE